MAVQTVLSARRFSAGFGADVVERAKDATGVGRGVRDRTLFRQTRKNHSPNPPSDSRLQR